ncbi:hypothetical protein C8J57DRAFT_1249148 [Mycena rebaudengoi]|nr:hypothetical protein C8J57DRAFT_1249148 [Mycena rebaudengoi]
MPSFPCTQCTSRRPNAVRDGKSVVSSDRRYPLNHAAFAPTLDGIAKAAPISIARASFLAALWPIGGSSRKSLTECSRSARSPAGNLLQGMLSSSCKQNSHAIVTPALNPSTPANGVWVINNQHRYLHCPNTTHGVRGVRTFDSFLAEWFFDHMDHCQLDAVLADKVASAVAQCNLEANLCISTCFVPGTEEESSLPGGLLYIQWIPAKTTDYQRKPFEIALRVANLIGTTKATGGRRRTCKRRVYNSLGPKAALAGSGPSPSAILIGTRITPSMAPGNTFAIDYNMPDSKAQASKKTDLLKREEQIYRREIRSEEGMPERMRWESQEHDMEVRT